MRTKTTVIVVTSLAALIIAAIVYLVVIRQPVAAPSQQNQQPAPTQPTANGAPPAATPAAPGEYITYTPGAEATTTNRKVLFFHASWCPQCRQLEQTINQQGVPDGMTIFKVNYDTATDLRQKYGVTLQTTIVEIDGQGNQINKFITYDDPTLNAVLAKLNP